MSAACRNLNVGQALVQGRNVTLTDCFHMSQHGHHFAEELYDPNLPKAVGCTTVPPLIQECHIVLLGFFRAAGHNAPIISIQHRTKAPS